MTRAIRFTLTVGACLAAMAAPASAQTLTELGGTMGLTDTLAGTSYPNLQAPTICSTTSLPDLDEDGNVIPRDTTCTQTQTPTTEQPATEQQATTTAPAETTAKSDRDYCRGLRGTSLRRCVAAMKKLRSGAVRSPARACAGLSRKRTAGRKTPFSRCVGAGRRLLADLS